MRVIECDECGETLQADERRGAGAGPRRPTSRPSTTWRWERRSSRSWSRRRPTRRWTPDRYGSGGGSRQQPPSLPDGAPLRVVAPVLRRRLRERLAAALVALGEAQLGGAEPAAPGGRQRLGALLAAAEVVRHGVPGASRAAPRCRRPRAAGPAPRGRAARPGARAGSAGARPGRASRRARRSRGWPPPVPHRAAGSGGSRRRAART